MWRYLAGAIAALLLAGGGILLFNGRAASDPALPAVPVSGGASAATLPDTAPEASDKTREEKRFSRYDKDSNGAITGAEYLANRRKAYARLDTDHDGKLSFDEWAVKAATKFATADADHNGAMSPVEFATTAAKRKPRPKCACPAQDSPAPEGKEDEG